MPTLRRKRSAFKPRTGVRFSLLIIVLLCCFSLVFTMHTSWKPDTNACLPPSSPGSPKFRSQPAGTVPDSPPAHEFTGHAFPPSPESNVSVAPEETSFDETITPPHDLDAAASRKWNRLCYQRQLLFDEVNRLTELDASVSFPFSRVTVGKETKMPHLDLVNSSVLPGLLGIMPQYKDNSTLKRNTKLCNYPGVVMTATEYASFTDRYGVYTGVRCTSLNTLIPEDSCWKHIDFYIVGDPTCFGAVINCVHGLDRKPNATLCEMMKVRQNVHYKVNDNGIIDICDTFITVRSRVNIRRGRDREEILLDYGKDYWQTDMTSCRQCLQTHSEGVNQILLCDFKNCNAAYHLNCLGRNLDELRKDPWFCPRCTEMLKHVRVDQALICSKVDRSKISRPSRAASASVQLLSNKHSLNADDSDDSSSSSSSSSSLSSSPSFSSSSSSSLSSSSDPSQSMSSASLDLLVLAATSPSIPPPAKRVRMSQHALNLPNSSTLGTCYTPSDVFIADENYVMTPSPTTPSIDGLNRTNAKRKLVFSVLEQFPIVCIKTSRGRDKPTVARYRLINTMGQGLCGTHALWMAINGIVSSNYVAVFELFESIIRAMLAVNERQDMSFLDAVTRELFQEEAYNILFANYWPGEVYLRAASIVIGRNIIVHPVQSSSVGHMFCSHGYELSYPNVGSARPIHLTYEVIPYASASRKGHHRLLVTQDCSQLQRCDNTISNGASISHLKQKLANTLFPSSPDCPVDVSSVYKSHREREFIIIDDEEEDLLSSSSPVCPADVSSAYTAHREREFVIIDDDDDLDDAVESDISTPESSSASEVDLTAARSKRCASHLSSDSEIVCDSSEDEHGSNESMPNEVVVAIEGDASRFLCQHVKLRFKPESTLGSPEYQVYITSNATKDLMAIGGEIVRHARPFEGVQIPTTKRFRSGRRLKVALADFVCKSSADVYLKLRDDRAFIDIPNHLLLDNIDVSVMLRTAIGCFAQHACPSHATSILDWFVVPVTNNVDSYIPYLKSAGCTFDATAENPVEVTFNYRADVKHSHVGCASCNPQNLAKASRSFHRKIPYKRRKPLKSLMPLADLTLSQLNEIEKLSANEHNKIPGHRNKKDRHKQWRHLHIDNFRAEWLAFEKCCGKDHMMELDENSNLLALTFKNMWMLNPIAVYAERIKFCRLLSKEKLKTKLFDFMQPYRSKVISRGNRFVRERIYEFVSESTKQRFCSSCAATLLGVSHKTFSSCARAVRNKKQLNAVHGNAGKASKNNKKCFVQQVLEAMKKVDEIHGQPVPNRKKRILPFVGSAEFAAFIRDNYHLQVETSTVTHIMNTNEHFQNVECTGDVKKNTFMRCTTCDGFTQSLKRADADERENIERCKRNHLYQIEFDRSIYYKHNQKALDNPNTYASLNFDGFDQAKTRLPHTIGFDTHAAQKRMEVHVSGFVSRGFAQPLILYMATPHYPNCANLTVTMLKDFLEKQADFARFEASLRRIVAKKDLDAIANKNNELRDKFKDRQNDAIIVDIDELVSEMDAESQNENASDELDELHMCPLCGTQTIDNDAHLKDNHSEEIHFVESAGNEQFRRPDTKAFRMSLFESIYILQNKLIRRNGEQYSWQDDYRQLLFAMIATKPEDPRRSRYMAEVYRFINKGFPTEDSLLFYANWKQITIRVFVTDKLDRNTVTLDRVVKPSGNGDDDQCTNSIDLLRYRQHTKWANRNVREFYLPLIKAKEFVLYHSACNSQQSSSEEDIIREVLKHITSTDEPDFADDDLANQNDELPDFKSDLKAKYPNFFDLKLTQQERVEFVENLKRATRKPEMLDFVAPASKSAYLADDEKQANKRLTASMAHVKNGTKWPNILYVSTDNCAKDNKNYAMINFYALLVCFGHFEKIKLNFPQVGHSHNWIDQIFSCLSRFLKRSAAYTIEAMMKAFHYAWSNLIHTDVKRAYSFKVCEMFDASEWLAKLADEIEGIREGYVYKIVPEYIKNDEDEVIDVHVYIYARLTSLTYYPNLKRSFRDEPELNSKYESKKLLMKRSEVEHKWASGKVPRDPYVVPRRAMDNPTYSELEKTIIDVQEKMADVSEKKLWTQQWSAWFKEQKQKDAEEDILNADCDQCAPLKARRDEARTAFDATKNLGEDDDEFKSRNKELRVREKAVRDHSKTDHRRIGTGWWSQNRIPKANAFFDEEEKKEQAERATIDHGSARTQNGHVVSSRQGEILTQGKRLQNDNVQKQIIRMNDIVVLLADETDSTYGFYPCFWIGQVVGFETTLERVENNRAVGFNDTFLETESQGMQGEVVKYRVQWFERYWTEQDTANWWSTNDDSMDAEGDPADGDMAKCQTMSEWKFIPSVNFESRIQRSWLRAYGGRRPVKGADAPFRCSNWGIDTVEKRHIIAIGDPDDDLIGTKFISSKGKKFEDVPENEITEDEDEEKVVEDDEETRMQQFQVGLAELKQLAQKMGVIIPKPMQTKSTEIRKLLATEEKKQHQAKLRAEKRKLQQAKGFKAYGLGKPLRDRIALAYQAQWKAQWVAYGHQKRVKA